MRVAFSPERESAAFAVIHVFRAVRSCTWASMTAVRGAKPAPARSKRPSAGAVQAPLDQSAGSACRT